MPHLKDLLKKRDKIDSQVAHQPPPLPLANDFSFVRTDTHTEEYIRPPAFASDQDLPMSAELKSPSPSRRSFGRFRKSSSPGASEVPSPEKEKREHRRLSERLHLNRDRAASNSSVRLPIDLPDMGRCLQRYHRSSGHGGKVGRARNNSGHQEPDRTFDQAQRRARQPEPGKSQCTLSVSTSKHQRSRQRHRHSEGN